MTLESFVAWKKRKLKEAATKEKKEAKKKAEEFKVDRDRVTKCHMKCTKFNQSRPAIKSACLEG